MAKSGLITLGNEESYGLSFVAGELLRFGQEVRFFDGEEKDIIKKLLDWQPDFLMFSPLTAFFKKALKIASFMPECIRVFGGHGIIADNASYPQIDITVKGPVRGSIDKILSGVRGLIITTPTTPDDMPHPARVKYYNDIPRAGKRYRKFMLSMLGCRMNCSYCSSSCSHIKSIFGEDAHNRYYLHRRPISHLIKELEDVEKYNTCEIDWVDDDVFAGDEDWMLEFLDYVTLPMYVSSSSVSILKTSDKLLHKMRNHVNVIGMGVQAIRPESLKLFNRQWDSEGKMKAAYDRLVSFGFRVNLQGIVGLPVDDPVEDAIETVMGMQRIGAGSICSCYPLIIYPGTKMEQYCQVNNIQLNEDCSGDTNSAICNILFDNDVMNQLKNICKLATLFVKYGISEKWVRALIRVRFDDNTSKQLSTLRYRECIIDRLGNDGERIFDDILKSMRLEF